MGQVVRSWIILIGVLPKPEEDDSLSDIEPDVCDVPDMFPVCGETAAVESLCFPVIVPTGPQGGCDPVLSLPRYRGGGGNHEVIVSGRESKVAGSDVSRDICLKPDLPVVELMAVPVVALTRSRVEGPLVVARPVDVILSGRESTVEMSDVNRDICMEPDFLPVVMSTDDVSLWPSLWSLRRDHGLAGARTCPCRWMRLGSPSLIMVWMIFFPDGSPPWGCQMSVMAFVWDRTSFRL